MIFLPGVSPIRAAAHRSVALTVLWLAGCPAPGQGYKANAGYRRAAPVIAALDRYYQERGIYPDTLADVPLEWLGPQPDAHPKLLHYVRRGAHYELSFSYSGPGVNHCKYDSGASEPPRWQCRGYY